MRDGRARDHHALALIADDDATMRLLLQQSLEQRDFRVIVAENGAQAIEAFITLNPDIVLLDVEMPDMDGFELVWKIKADERLKQIPVIILTSTGMIGDTKICRELGIKGYLTKPVEFESMISRVEKAIYFG